MGLIYLDNNATTRIDEQVLNSMLPFLRDNYGNASSLQHRMGREANNAVEHARRQVASRLHVRENEIIFTSGATEGINMALRGIAKAYVGQGKHIITCTTEHRAVLSTCQNLEKQGFTVTYLPVDEAGNIDLDVLLASITPETILVSLMAANNETGVLHPLESIAQICQEKDVLFFCDATQLVGKKEIDLQRIPIDILALSAHKIHGPKGIGALFIRRKSKPIQIPALISGGSQEKGLRGGTLNVPSIVGLGKAIETAYLPSNIQEYRDYIEQQVALRVPEIQVHSKDASRLGNTSNIAFRHIKSAEIMSELPDIVLSAGSACASGLLDPSHVLKAMHLSDADAFSSIRIGLSRYTERKEIEQATEMLIQAVETIRARSPIWQLYLDGSL